MNHTQQITISSISLLTKSTIYELYIYYDNFSQPHIGNPKLFIFSIYYHFTYHQNHHQICWGLTKSVSIFTKIYTHVFLGFLANLGKGLFILFAFLHNLPTVLRTCPSGFASLALQSHCAMIAYDLSNAIHDRSHQPFTYGYVQNYVYIYIYLSIFCMCVSVFLSLHVCVFVCCMCSCMYAIMFVFSCSGICLTYVYIHLYI